MAKIPEWLKSDGLSDEEIKSICCPNGSFSCGFLTKLGMKTRCNSCKNDNSKIKMKGIDYIQKYEKTNPSVCGTRELIHYTEWLIKELK